jgi:hypothetical protein
MVIHDLIIDGWSMGVLMREVSELYAVFKAGRPSRLPAPALQFPDFARWQRRWSISDAATRQFDYWKGHLRNAAPVFSNKAREIEAKMTAGTAEEQFHISNRLIARIRALSHSHGATLFMALLTGFKTLLMLRSGRHDICVATMMANRSQLGTERAIGPFANTILIRTQIDFELSFQEALSRVRKAVLEAYARQELPFDIIAARFKEETGFDPTSLAQIYFIVEVAPRSPIKLPGVTVRPFGYSEGLPIMPIDSSWLTMTLKETPTGIIGTCRYKSNMFEPNAGRHWTEEYKTILAKAAVNPNNMLKLFVNH